MAGEEIMCQGPARAIARATLALLVGLGPLFAASNAAAAADPLDRLRSLSIEDLSNIEVTTVSRRAEPLSKAAAAVFVITNDDIRRSGVNSLPEVLRLAPNLQVTRVNAQSYAITARGFGTFEAAIKLLVLIDGRSIYTPLHAGVFWDQNMPMLEDIERIEVISGPGGTLWGANAFNGVINIITKGAASTQGGLVSAQIGAEDKDGAARFGGKLGDKGHFRVYGKAFDRVDSLTAIGNSGLDGWDGAQTGFRTDWQGESDAVTVQADLFAHDFDSGGRLAGRNILARWNRALEGGAGVEVQAYYDAVDRLAPTAIDKLDTFDIEAQHTVPIGESHTFVWGGGHRMNRDKFSNTTIFQLRPERDTVQISNIFLQDDYRVLPDLTLTLGSKFEYTSFTGLEYMPNARLGWEVTDRDFLWGAVSRAVRTPARFDRDLGAAGVLERARGFRSEELTAYELGYRGRPTDNSSLSVSLFYHDYDELRILARSSSGLLMFDNKMHGHSWGAEVWGDYQATSWWRLKAGYSLLRKKLFLEPGAVTTAYDQHAGNDPDHQFQIRSQFNLPHDLELDFSLRAIDDLPEPHVAAYVQADARLGWRATESLELSVAGLNLLHASNQETRSYAARREFGRTVLFSARTNF